MDSKQSVKHVLGVLEWIYMFFWRKNLFLKPFVSFFSRSDPSRPLRVWCHKIYVFNFLNVSLMIFVFLYSVHLYFTKIIILIILNIMIIIIIIIIMIIIRCLCEAPLMSWQWELGTAGLASGWTAILIRFKFKTLKFQIKSGSSR